jgi:hypothetical protein
MGGLLMADPYTTQDGGFSDPFANLADDTTKPDPVVMLGWLVNLWLTLGTRERERLH